MSSSLCFASRISPKPHCRVCTAWPPAFAGVTTPSQRLVISAQAETHSYCVLQRPAWEVDHISSEMRAIDHEPVGAVTNDRFDFGIWERIFWVQAERLARES